MESILSFGQFTIEDRVRQYIDAGMDRSKIRDLVNAEFDSVSVDIDAIIDKTPVVHITDEGSRIATIPKSIKKMPHDVMRRLLAGMSPGDVIMVRNGGMYFYDEIIDDYQIPSTSLS